MKPLSPLVLLSLLHEALAGGNDMASGCVSTRVLPTVTTGCSENLPGATKQPGHSAPYGSGSYSPADPEPEDSHHTGTKSLDAKPNQPTSSDSGHGSGYIPTIDGQPGSNTTGPVPGSTEAPQFVSGSSDMVARIRAELVVVSLLASFMPILMGLI
ncbi:uncharacterized protein FTJAE_5296 [Fusarium tjaetaba]|uniref:Uncharacterized protein n=1 Tax=Fusarium tjaetaba TaxID=1567544 RepID=A0A8H5RUI0_9HYPO|nr:uncharacterized protein FTJAE_5296 [Fusarium tjaetaba]KAF5638391.1 hypothetical protein FTJAE_5296 [Fusarium tjaetaba]